MSDSKILLQPAFILHQRKYRETSLILDVLTEDFGVIHLLAKGVRKAKSRMAGLIRPFKPLAVSYAGKSELKTLTHVEIISTVPELTGTSLFCGLYLNELVSYFLHPYDPHLTLFNDYRHCLIQLSSNENEFIETSLRLFELALLENIGFALPLEYDFNNEKSIQADKRYHYVVNRGAYEVDDGQFSGLTLIALRNKKLENRQILNEAKLLMRKVLDFHLEGKTLNSRNLFKKLNPTQLNN